MELKLEKVPSKNFIELQKALTNPDNIDSYKIPVVKLTTCGVNYGGSHNNKLSFDISLKIQETTPSGKSIPRKTILELFDILNLFSE